MSNEQHLQDVADGLPHEPVGGPAGGACLNRHEGGAPDSPRRNSCYHRWQAYEKMPGEQSYYNDPKYQSLVARRGDWIKVAAPGMPPYARRYLPRPKAKEWDYGNSCVRRVWNRSTQTVETRPVKNFYERASVPYNHQAHHLVANGELADTILKVFSDIGAVVPVRRGLLEAKYNLNHMDNMIMLPMDRVVSQSIGLPLHQASWAARSHKAWSTFVYSELEPIFAKIKKQFSEHQPRDYVSARQELEDLARDLRAEVLALAGRAATLDVVGRALSGS